jgi:hypothetical protein
MSVVNEPTNKNFLSPLGFDFRIKKLPTTNFFVTRTTIPGISLGVVESPTPFVKLPIPGDKIVFNDLQVTFKIDEDMKNYLEIFNWMMGLGFPEKFDQYAVLKNKARGSGDGIYSDGILTILTSAMNPNIEFSFRNVFPYSLTDVDFNTSSADVEYLEATVGFRYELFTINSL